MAVADAPRKTRAAAVREAARARLAAALKSTRLTDAYRQRRLTGDQRRRLYARLVVEGQRDFRALARRATDGELSGAEWRRAMRRGVEVLHHAAALSGSDTGTLSRGDITLLNRQTGEQWEYLDAFRRALESDDLTPKQAAARAANYARAAWGIAENLRLDRMRRDGFKYVRRILGRVERHCSDCPRLARQGWLPIKQMTPLGNTSCSSGCNCHFEFSKARPKGYQAPKRKAAPKPKVAPRPIPVAVAPVVAAPRPGDQVEVVGAVDPALAAEIRAAYEALPERARAAVQAAGARVVVSRRLADALPEHADDRPRGWSDQATWKNSDGAYRADRKIALACQEYLDPYSGSYLRSSRTVGVMRHEFGHALDAAILNASRTDRFRDAYRQDKIAILLSGKRADYAYFLQDGHAGPQEAFAELFGQIHGGGSDRLDLIAAFPSTSAYLRSLLQ